MATIEDIRGVLDVLNTPPTGLDLSSIIPDKVTIMKGLLGKSIPMPSQGEETLEEYTEKIQSWEENLTSMAQQSVNSFMGAQVEVEINNLKSNLTSFMTTVPTLVGSIVAQITTVAANPVTLNCVPSLISGIKSQLGTLTSQATQILNSCVFLNIEIPDSIIAVIESLAGVKTALDAIPI